MNPQPRSSGIVAQWAAIRRVYPIYTAVVEQFNLGKRPYASLDDLAGQSEAEVIRDIQAWLESMDDRIESHQFRQILEGTDILNSEDKLRVLVHRHLAKEHRSEADRAKLHYLLTQYFFVCCPPSFRSREVKLDEVAQVLEPVLGEMPAAVPESLDPLTCLVEQMPKCSSLGELQSSILEPGRELKAHAIDSHFDIATLVVFTYFNYSARCAFRRLISAEVKAVEEGLTKIEAYNVKTVNCTSAGLSAEEPVEAIRTLLEGMKSSVAPSYAVDSAGKQVRALRLAVAAAVDRAASALTGSDQARVSTLESQVQRLIAEMTQLRRDLNGPRSLTARVVAQSNRAAAAPMPSAPSANGTGATASTPEISPAPVEPEPSPVTPGKAASSANAAEDKRGTAESNVANAVERCIEQLQKLLADGSVKASGLVKVGTETVLLAGSDIDAIRASGEAAAVAQRAIALRVLLIKFIENARRGQCGDVAPWSAFTQGVLTDLKRAASRSESPARDALTSNGRQLRTVLQHAESVVRKARMARQSA
ncbi:MAG: hypothetical protein ACXVZZ_12740 [Terriglobales bacterium]